MQTLFIEIQGKKAEDPTIPDMKQTDLAELFSLIKRVQLCLEEEHLPHLELQNFPFHKTHCFRTYVKGFQHIHVEDPPLFLLVMHID